MIFLDFVLLRSFFKILCDLFFQSVPTKMLFVIKALKLLTLRLIVFGNIGLAFMLSLHAHVCWWLGRSFIDRIIDLSVDVL